jgi:predicted DNA binding protein
MNVVNRTAAEGDSSSAALVEHTGEGTGTAIDGVPNAGLVAQVSATHSDFTLRSVVRKVPETTLFVVEFSERSDGSAIVFVEVEGGDPCGFEDALADESGIVQWEAVSEGSSRRLYCVHLDGSGPNLRRACTEVSVHVSQMVSHEEGWLLNLRLPDREALTELAARWRDDGVSFQLKRLTQTCSGNRDGHCAELTAEQYQLLWTAHQHGYFEVPRGASQTDLARELGVSTSGFSQRIRRALDALLGSVFEGERADNP